MHLDVGDGHRIWVTTTGDPAGPPALFVHSGPGSGTLVHGRLDVSGPADTAWELARRWPDADLTIVGDAGHTSSPATDEVLRRALRVV